ncbi:YggU family protein [Thiohalocapsa marina]|uniref:UPF0235 protein F2Q65_09425 n=1 Tax=Thiohalocapsa marina TaxID=424902 RepID=A0A5M8FKQ2_9GAMM|nr:DUF167 family protein [Thiohalocapsa marina]KAA6185309.1 YggU family protein [Thiohalocapsa marina]
MAWRRWQDDALVLSLRVQPRARSDGFGEPLGDELRLRLRAPPVDDKANAHLIAFVADAFGVPRRQVEIIGGEHARSKVVRITAPTKDPFASNGG